MRDGRLRVLVMGGTQLLGLETVLELLRRRHDVCVFNRGTRSVAWPAPVLELRGDRDVPADLQQLEGLEVDGAIDFSCFTGRQAELFAAVTSHVPHVVQCSTGAVYAPDPALPWSEALTPVTGWPLYGDYALDKLAAEEALVRLRPEGATTTILRPPYVLAPGNTSPREEWVLNRLLDGAPIHVPGDGKAVIQFVTARQVATTAVNALETFADGDARAFNVAEPGAVTSALGFVALCAEVAGGATPRIVYVAPSRDRVERDLFPFPSENYVLDTRAAQAAGIQAPATTLRSMLAAAHAHLLADPTRRSWRPTAAELAHA
jgi:nucleoside-diphosphate-sugar epimerase